MERNAICRRLNLDLVEARAVDGSTDLPPITGMAALYFDPANPDATQYQLRPNVVERMSRGLFEGPLNASDDVLALQDHNPDLFLGRRSSGTLALSLNDRGLGYTIRTPNTRVGKDTLELIERRDITGSSFSMWKPKGHWSEESAGPVKRYVRTVDSFERIHDVGPVLAPAYSGTSATIGARSCGITHVYRSVGPPAEMAEIEAELADFVQRNWFDSEAAFRLRQLELRQLDFLTI